MLSQQDHLWRTYDQAPFSNTSRLTKVQKYGRDATVASDGAVTGSSVKTIRQMTYDNPTFSYSAKTGQFTNTSNNDNEPNPNQPPLYATYSGDLDFDGRDELYGVGRATTARQIVVEAKQFADDGTVSITTTGKVTPPEIFNATRSIGAASGLVLSARVSAAKNTRDIIFSVPSTTYPDGGGGGGNTTPSSDQINFLAKTSSNLAVQTSSCPKADQAACDLLSDLLDSGSASMNAFNAKRLAVADPEGDGIDSLFKFNDSVVGVADFRGNGRQGAITGKDNSKAARMVDGAWVYSTIGA
ncbi:MAG: hypothetical protein EON58_18095, partial [Alphaproteobacteria bacterium]